MKTVLFRAAQQNCTIFITFYLIRRFELTTISMVNNAQTICTVILCYLILGEKTTNFGTCISLAVGVAATIIFVMGDNVLSGEESRSGEEFNQDKSTSAAFAMILLALNPVFISVGQIAMKQMEDIQSPTLASAYMNGMLLFVMLVVVYASGSDLTPWKSFSWIEWLSIASLSLSNVCSQTFRFMASQRSPLAPLQSLSFSQTVFQFAADLFLFNEAFSWLQIGAIGVVFLTCVLQIVVNTA